MKLSFVFLLALCVTATASYSDDSDFTEFGFDKDENEVKAALKIEKNNNKATDLKGNEILMKADGSDDVAVEDDIDLLVLKLQPLAMTSIPFYGPQWYHYWVEMLLTAGLVVYFVNYTMGKKQNIRIANAWLEWHISFLEENFALVGDDGKKEAGMSRESDSLFTLWCSGRVCCEGALFELKLVRRQDLLAVAMELLNRKSRDQVVVKVEISKDSMDTFVFALGTKKTASRMMKDMSDVVSGF